MDILNEKIEGLVKKAEKSKMPYGILKKVYDRGMAAWKTGHRPGTTPQQWAFARVNSFITKSSGTWGKADADLAKQVRGEQVEKRTTAKSMLGQVREKLDKDSDAGDYVKDFRKSDAPQFKGKSDKKKQKMAIAAYLDSKEEVELDEAMAPHEVKISKTFKTKNPMEIKGIDRLIDMSSIGVVQSMQKQNPKGFKKTIMNLGKMKEEVELEEGQAGRFRSAGAELERYAKKSGRMDKNDFIKAAGMMKKGDSHGLVKFVKSLDTEPRDYVIQTVKRAVGKDLTQKMFSVKIKEEKRQLKDPKKEAMVMKVKDSGSIQVIDKKDLKKYLSKGYIQVEDNIKEENCPDCDKDPCKCKPLDEGKYTLPITHVIVDTRTNKVTHASSDDKGLKLDVGRKSHLKIVKLKKPVSQKKTGYLLGEPLKAWGEEVDNITEERVFVVRFEKEGMRFAVPFSDMKTAKDGEKILKKSAGVSDVSITKDILKPGVKFKRTQEGKIVKESKMGELFLDMQMDAQDMNEREFIKTYSKMGFQAAELKSLFKQFNEEVIKVDNSLMAQATRVISQTSIKEKIDPADVDNIATVDDRKAADKNIIIQLRRAQDMKGKADVTFKDKPSKKEKIDIRVINKALDMFDKMKPNDKAKMQTTIGKSYRDLLKTVQRGRI